jgi:hypothetical protein
MYKKRRLFLSLLAVAVLVATMLLPMTASAGRFTRETDWMWVPANLAQPKTLSVDGISVTIPVGAMPDGGIVILRVLREPAKGWFQADFLPDRTFAVPVLMDFGDVYELNYMSPDGPEPIVPRSPRLVRARFLSPHFSRYSGWH